MEIVKKIDAIKKQNSPHWFVYEYAMKTKAMNIGVAKIMKRYPDQGYAVNHECCEMGYVVRGSGKLITEMSEVSLSAGDVVFIPPGEKYYWEGFLTVVLPAHQPGIPISMQYWHRISATVINPSRSFICYLRTGVACSTKKTQP